MKITRRTKMREILPMLNDERIAMLSDKVAACPLAKPLLSMTCGEFIGALDERYAMSFFGSDERVCVAFGRYKQYIAEMQQVTAYLQRYEVEQEADEKAAANGVDFPSMQERILLDCVRHYNLHSTAEAERLPIADWLLCVKSEGAAAQYQRKLSKIRQNKAKHGNK